MLSFPSANRDASQFERADEVVLDRQHNRHIAFGAGIHRCIGSNLARMETEVALRGWLRRFPRFELAGDPADIRWSNGAVRGPHHVPLRILEPEPRAGGASVSRARRSRRRTTACAWRRDVSGPPDGPPALLLHGLGQSRQSWGGTAAGSPSRGGGRT